MKRINEDVWVDSDCLYIACQRLMESYTQTLAWMRWWWMNDKGENDNELRKMRWDEMSDVKRSENWHKYNTSHRFLIPPPYW